MLLSATWSSPCNPSCRISRDSEFDQRPRDHSTALTHLEAHLLIHGTSPRALFISWLVPSLNSKKISTDEPFSRSVSSKSVHLSDTQHAASPTQAAHLGWRSKSGSSSRTEELKMTLFRPSSSSLNKDKGARSTQSDRCTGHVAVVQRVGGRSSRARHGPYHQPAPGTKTPPDVCLFTLKEEGTDRRDIVIF